MARIIAAYLRTLASKPRKTKAARRMRASVPMLTNDSQIGSDLRVWADEDD